MTARQTVDSMVRLLDLRQREVDRRLAEVAEKQALGERYRRNLEKLDALSRQPGGSGQTHPGIAMNSANYKIGVLHMAQTHRQELALHDADLAIARQQLAEASRRHEALRQLLEREQRSARRQENTREQKSQDEIAALVWQRRTA